MIRMRLFKLPLVADPAKPLDTDLDGIRTALTSCEGGKILKDADVYFELKDRLAHSKPAEAEAFLKDLHRHGTFYAKFVQPARDDRPGSG